VAFESSDIRRPSDADADADARDFTACDAAVFDCDGTLVGACIGDAMQRARLMTF
jgi:hypothetical protein